MRIQRRGCKKLLWWFYSALMLSYFVSCSSNTETAIVGKWRVIGGTETMECFKDGTLTVSNSDKGMNLGGTFKFVDKDRIKVELGGLAALAGPFVATVSISGDELTWTMPNGQVSKYRRAQ
jgi:hypothetical protein